MTIGVVLDAVARNMNVPVGQLVGPSRNAWTVRARDIVCWIARTHLRMSLTAIGQALGERHHTTIMTAIDRAFRMRADIYWRRRIARIAMVTQ